MTSKPSTIDPLRDRLELIELCFDSSHALISLQGAQLCSYRFCGRELLWMSPNTATTAGKAIRGGIPICWPWFGDHPSDASLPAHGIARTARWQVSELAMTETASVIELQLTERDIDRSVYPPAFELRLRARLDAHQLAIELITINSGPEAIEISEALHSYLAVSDIDQASIHGLSGCVYADKLKQHQQAREQREAVTVTEPTDRIYIDDSAALQLVDGEYRLEIGKAGSANTVIWNPGAARAAQMADIGTEHYRGFVCIEAANAPSHRIHLAPGEQHSLSQILRPEPGALPISDHIV